MLVGGAAEDRRESFFRRAARGILTFSICVLAILGLVAIAVELYSWHMGWRWRPEDINVLIANESPTRRFVSRIWEELKFVIQYGALFIGAVAFAVAISQIKTVARLISDFIVARGPIYALGTTITEVEKSVAVLSRDVDRLSKLEPAMTEMAEKIEETFAQIANLQRLTVSERSGPAVEGAVPQSANGRTTQSISDEERNWERLRELWNANGERLDAVIERITDKRRRGRFRKMSRNNYPAIIDALATQGYISEPARKASQDLHSAFMSYKPRNRKIPDEAVGALEVLDRMLQKELGLPDDEPPKAPNSVDTDVPAPA
jgi:hypothetical protein